MTGRLLAAGHIPLLLAAPRVVLPARVERRMFNRRTFWDQRNGTDYYDAIETSLASLNAYGPDYDHWVITYSGGKDSSAVLSFVLWAIENGFVPRPRRLSVLYADTFMELPPLEITAEKVLQAVAQCGMTPLRVAPPLEKRFWVQILGRGLPPPRRNQRWCTRVLKADPMEEAVAHIRAQYGDRALLLTGVRMGESATRDGRIAASCSTDDGECGQGWYQQDRHALAPLLNWRVCHVWKWIYSAENPLPIVRDIEPVYQADDIVDIRTGCIGCNIVQEDIALKFLVANPRWSYLSPLLKLHALYEEMLQPQYRLRHGVVRRADGSVSAAKTGKMGPLTIDARRYFLWRVQQLEAEANYIMIDPDEEMTIRQMWRDGVYPRDWTGNEETASDSLVKYVISDGQIVAVQNPLIEDAA